MSITKSINSMSDEEFDNMDESELMESLFDSDMEQTSDIVKFLNSCRYTTGNSIGLYPESWDFSVLKDAVKFGYLTSTAYPGCYNYTQYTLTEKGKLTLDNH